MPAYLQVWVPAQRIHHQVDELLLGDNVLTKERQALQEVLVLLPVAHALLHLQNIVIFIPVAHSFLLHASMCECHKQ